MSNRNPEPDDLRALEARLEDMRRREAAKNRKPPPSPMGVAYRFATELVVAMVVGGGIGWGLDKAFATRPVFLIVCFLLGAAAGIRNTVRTATKMNQAAARGATPPPAADDDEER
ncbi:MAG: AtpZ/AtpI family protein [Alphaproteobacteria bacterium]|nr:AtpZ/AtpI family protein [Alphaproteobacteria bacterium]